jgi:alkylated DNA nucleotide flippase Atl1
MLARRPHPAEGDGNAMRTDDDLHPSLVERVLAVVLRIPPGLVLSYGDVARLASTPTARDVGQVMLRHGDGRPWWRVLRADGTPAPHLREQQLTRLRAEATPMLPSGEGVDMRQARWLEARRGPESGVQPSLFD